VNWAFCNETSAVFQRLGGGCVLVHKINLLKRQTLGLEKDSRSADGRERPTIHTSGIQKYVKIMQQKHVEPQMKKTLASRPADPGALLTR
jgi:hypothetical protein